jgi:hypothetical protein
MVAIIFFVFLRKIAMEDDQQPKIDYKDLFKAVMKKQEDLEKDLKSGLSEEQVRTDAVHEDNWATAAPIKERVWTLEEEKLRVLEQNAQFYEDGGDPLAGFRRKYHSGKKDWTLKDPDMAQWEKENGDEDVVDNRRGIS